MSIYAPHGHAWLRFGAQAICIHMKIESNFILFMRTRILEKLNTKWPELGVTRRGHGRNIAQKPISLASSIVAETKIVYMGAGMGRKQSVSAHDTRAGILVCLFFFCSFSLSVCLCVPTAYQLGKVSATASHLKERQTNN